MKLPHCRKCDRTYLPTAHNEGFCRRCDFEQKHRGHAEPVICMDCHDNYAAVGRRCVACNEQHVAALERLRSRLREEQAQADAMTANRKGE